MYISEFLANPNGVSDANGEWVELYNAGPDTANLEGWQLKDLGSDSHTIAGDLLIAPGAYVVLARNSDSTANGGISAAYRYTKFTLGNDDDEILLLRPDGSEEDRVVWGGTSGLSIRAGESFERTAFNGSAWVPATTVWPGSAGDLGTPGSGYAAPVSTATPTATPTATTDDGPRTATATPTPTGTTDSGPLTATPTVTPTATTDDGLPIATPTVTPTATTDDGPPTATSTATPTASATPTPTTNDGGNGSVFISEFLADPSAVADADGEWIELYNAGPDSVNLRGWTIADLDSDSHTITSDLFVGAGGYVVLARNADFAENGGVRVDYVYIGVTLANSADEILLLRPNGTEEDRVVWGNGSGLNISRGDSLERTNFVTQIWVTAISTWPNSLGDFGTPGSGFVPPSATGTPTPTATTDSGPRTATTTVTATPTATLTPTADDGPLTATPTITATPTATLTPTADGGPPTATPTATLTPTADGGPLTATSTTTPTPTATIGGEANISVFISEFLADPSAVSDANGEWLELHNAGPDGVNLRGWTIADLDSDSHTIAADLFVAAGGYVVLALNADFAENGGVSVDYVYSGITLANSADEILLLRPNGTEEDRVLWGDAAWRVTTGKSLERITFGPVPVWLTAGAVWPGSAGDFGTPGRGFVPPSATGTPTPTATTDDGPPTATPTVTPTPTATFTPTADDGPSTPTPTATLTPTPTASALPTPTATISEEMNAAVFISEFLADPSAVSDANGEWIELYNAGPDSVNLKGWTLADLDSDSHTIAADLFVGAGGYVVLGRNGDSLENGGVTLQYVYSGVTLANSADEILLLRPDGTEEDRVVWGDDAAWRVTPGKSLERITFGPVPVWLTAGAAWPGSAGDFGTPGRGFVPPSATGTPTPTATTDGGPLTATSTATLTPTADGGQRTATPTATLTPTADDGPLTATPTATLTPTADGGPLTATPTATLTPTADGGPLTATSTATLTPTADDGPSTATPTATPTATASQMPSSTPTPTATIGGEANASVFISEFLADPSAVSDANGEWFELHNAGPDGVNLRGWTIADLDSDNHTITSDLFLAAGGYVVLGRNGDSLENGGVSVDYVYSGVTLANSADEIILLRPDGSEEDRVVWGGGGPWRVTPGKSLERITFGPVPVWLTAGAAWPGSAGDFGTPGSGFVPPSATGTPTPTATATTDSGPRTATTTVTPTATLTPTADGGPLTATSTATPTPTATIGGEANASVFISEFLADPSAVSDANGEWIELYNAGPDPVNLSNWVLADLSRDRHVITDEIVVAPDAYVVLARKSDPSANGGVVADYVYSGVNLANDEDEILLLRPNGDEEDRVIWGGSSDLRPERGKSLERTGFGPLAQWVVAASAWPGSAGDFGSPGSGFVPPVGTATPTPTVTPTVTPTATPTADGGAQTATVTATATPSATVTPTPSATPVILPALWPPVTEPALLRIDEVNFQGSDLEFVALVNVGDSPLNLTGWVVGDGATPGGGEGLYALPEGQLLAPHAPFVIARNAAAFHTHWGRPPDAQFEESESSVPVLERRRELASGRLALNDSGDEVLLLDPSLALADGVVWGSGDGVGLGLTGTLDRITDRSLQRVPGFVFPTERDPRHRFLWAAPAPFASVVLPERAVVPGPSLADGLQAVWGSLAAASNFTPGGAAPPHYVQAAGANVGLGFVAVADPLEAIRQRSVEDQLAAWRWTGSDGGGAIVYGPPFATDGTTGDFLAGLASSGGLAQWLPSGVPPGSAEVVVALAADGLTVPGGLPNFSSRWESGPRLPAGNAQPPVAGAAEPNPRYTGLAAADTTEAGLLEALAARRGWLTDRPGLALTLRAHTADGIRWMGSAIEPQDALAVEIDYHDWNGHVAGLALWLNDRPIAQTDLPQGNGVWQTIVSAAPGSVLYAVATQADGDFAVTAPLLVGNGDGARVVLNEVLPAPAADWNGDGTIDSNDEFIELYNPGETPVSLAGWRLEDRSNSTSTRRRFVLGVEHLLPAGGFLAIWGRDSHIGLNDDGDRVELYDSSDRLVDGMEWNSRMERGKSLSRVPNGGNWQSREPSPGSANPDDAPGAGGSGESPESLPPWGSGAAPGTPGGEAVGPFRSVTAAKLAGMEDGVQFVGVVTVPPGLFNSVIYVADPALPPNDATAWLGVQVYLRRGDFPPLAEGDRVEIRGTMHSFRGEREILVERPEDIWRVGPGNPLQPLAIDAGDVGEPLEGRLVTFEGIVTGWLGVSIFLADPAQPDAEPVMVTVRSSLGWRRPYVNKGERWQVTGIVSQSAAAAPWNGGYRVLVRYPQDLSEK